MRITIDEERCVGAGQCVLGVPEVFDLGDDGKATLLQPRPAAEYTEGVQGVAQWLCPAKAIQLAED